MNEINEKTKNYVIKCCAVVFGVCAAMIFIKFNEYDDFMKTTESQIEKLKENQNKTNKVQIVTFDLNSIKEKNYAILDSLDNNFKFAFYIDKLEKFAGGTKITIGYIPLSQFVINSFKITVLTSTTQEKHIIKKAFTSGKTTLVLNQSIDSISSISIKDVEIIDLDPL